ncbi:MAG: hypothetical protein RLZZ385_2648 [Pseudomonadota bacterium]|jgi:hypothetical protein
MSDPENQHILQIPQASRALALNIESLSRGIDNYHIDVKLSKKFCNSVKKVADLLVSQLAVPNPKNWDNSTQLEEMRDNYVDLMTVLIHRVKTNLQPNEISFLQLAPIKYIIKLVRARLNDDLDKLAARTSELRNKGSTEALASDQKLFWLRKNYDSILYTIQKQIFNQLHRAENKHLAALRQQFLPAECHEFAELMFNPLLFSNDLSGMQLLVSEYCVWDTNSQPNGFVQLNERIEQLLQQMLKDFPAAPLKGEAGDQAGITEITDEMGGFVASQPFLGQARDSKDLLAETITWLEDPVTLQRVFSLQKHQDRLLEVRKTEGFGAWWRQRGEVNHLRKVLLKLTKILKSQNLLPQILSGWQLRTIWTSTLAERMDMKTVSLYLGSSNRKPPDSFGPGQNPTPEQLRFLEETRLKIQQQVADVEPETAARVLVDVSRYRLHLKYFRLTHRIFNRISLLTKQDDIQLSREAGTLYALPTSSEIEEDEERIVHHTILKADVRGSTTVTDELTNKGLNPASYFSLRFFGPINKFLDTFGANKVFIEGDAIILSFLEYEHTPQQWFSVARACGMAKEMLTIVGQNNRHSTQMGLPVLELGIGICYSNEAPRYLYDDDRPIMISGAIGLADRLSSCSWNLRKQMQPGLFNIDVFRYAEGEKGKGEKGQHYVRYNVNGILIDNVAFAKLAEEVSLQKIRVKLNGRDYLFHTGTYPDLQGRKRELIIREGQVGLWRNETMEDNPDDDEKYYEVVVNRKVITLVLEVKNRNKTEA